MLSSALPGRAVLTGSILLASLAGCGQQELDPSPVASPTAVLSDGTYRVAYGQGYAAADEPHLLAVTARLDRGAKQLVLTMADGSQQRLTFSPRPTEQWQPDCATLDGHVLDEVADLAPAPLRLESMTFETPLVYAKCGPRRMILARALGDESFGLVFDLQ